MGFNAQSDPYENLVDAGVIDPIKVVRVALQNGTTGTEKPTSPDARKEDDTKTIPSFTVTALKMVADSCAKPAL